MARVTNAQLAERIDNLTKGFGEFKIEVRDKYEKLNGRQRDLTDRLTTLESAKANPGKPENPSRLEDPRVLLALVGAIVILAEVIGRLV